MLNIDCQLTYAPFCIVKRYRYTNFFVRLRNVLINNENRSAILHWNRMSLVCNIYHLFMYLCFMMGRDISVGIVTRYGLDGPGIESRWGRIFPHPWSPHSLLYNGYRQGRIKLFGAPRQWKHFRPLFQAVFLSGGVVLPPQTESNTTPPSPKTEITNILFYILNLWLRIYCSCLRGCDTLEKEIVIWPCWCFMADIIFTLLILHLCL